MAVNGWIIERTVDLAHPPKTLRNEQPYEIAYTGDMANPVWVVHVLQDGQPVALGGSVKAYIRRIDGAEVISNGTISGNTVSVQLGGSNFGQPGYAWGILRYTDSTTNATVTLDALTMIVQADPEGTSVLDPDDMLPTLQELLAELDDMRDATAAAEAAAECIADNYNANATYAVGDYTLHNGGLYRCTTAITSAETWTAAHWTQVVFGSEVRDLKSVSNYSYDQLGSYEYGLLDKPYEKRFTGLLKTGVVHQYFDAYEDSARAFFKIEDAFIDGDVYIFNPKGYTVCVYYRQKSDNNYIGYAVPANVRSFFKFTPDTSAYDYWLMAIHITNGSESFWNSDDLEDANRNVHIYSGKYNNSFDSLSLRFSPNLITSDKIHVGKYYYGAATPADNAQMAYTDLISVKEKHKYYIPYMTLGWSWYASDERSVLGGGYSAVEGLQRTVPYTTLEAPEGASFIGVSCRTGDVPNMILSELADSRSTVEEISAVPVAASKVIREPLNWIVNSDFKQNRSGSRLRGGDKSGTVWDGEKVILTSEDNIYYVDQISMDKSKIDIIFAVPANTTPSYILGMNGYYSIPSLAISDGGIAVLFKNDGRTAEVRMGTGQNANYPTLLESIDVSGLNISSGRKFVLSIEKDTINKYIVSIYDALTPNNVVTVTIEAEQNQQDENLYSGQIRGWGGPYAHMSSDGSLLLYKMQMYSTAPTYPHVAIWGDSYVENCGRNPRCAYANLIREALNGNAFLSGQGGATAAQTFTRVVNEINVCAPQYIIFNVGVNDSFGVSADTFKENLLKLIELAKEKGSEPILVTVPNVPAGNATVRTFCQEVNPWIRSLGYDYIDIAYALSTGDGITGDESKFVLDMTHPNLVGGQAIFNYIKAHLPQLLWRTL